jgi:hypothetical protein
VAHAYSWRGVEMVGPDVDRGPEWRFSHCQGGIRRSADAEEREKQPHVHSCSNVQFK